MHQATYTASCLLIAVLAILGLRFDTALALLAVCIGVAVVGIPHGGLDHLRGRRWLTPIVGHYWSPLFFISYLAVAIAIASAWMVVPAIAIVLFFLLSAWHFGWDEIHDDIVIAKHGKRRQKFGEAAYTHAQATAKGGLVIWIPAIFRSEEMSRILQMTLISGDPSATIAVVRVTQWIGMAMLVVLAADILFFPSIAAASSTVRYLSQIIMFVFVPIVFSFGIYFCVWHSWQGLKGLKREFGVSTKKLIAMTFPLTFAAICLIAVAGKWLFNGVQLSDQATATLFIGLASIAVPHLLLHGMCDWSESRRSEPDSLIRFEGV